MITAERQKSVKKIPDGNKVEGRIKRYSGGVNNDTDRQAEANSNLSRISQLELA
jgi:hypothetical protein